MYYWPLRRELGRLDAPVASRPPGSNRCRTLEMSPHNGTRDAIPLPLREARPLDVHLRQFSQPLIWRPAYLSHVIGLNPLHNVPPDECWKVVPPSVSPRFNAARVSPLPRCGNTAAGECSAWLPGLYSVRPSLISLRV